MPFNATLPVCLASPAALAVERVPQAAAAAPLCAVLVYSAGCGGVARGLAAAGAVAALYGAQLRVHHCDVGARQTLLGRVADAVDTSPLRPAVPLVLPAFVVYAHGAPVATTAATAAALVPALQRAAPALRRVLAVARTDRAGHRTVLAPSDAAAAHALETRLLRGAPLVHGLAPAAARHAAAAAHTWAAKRLLGCACALGLAAAALCRVARTVRARRDARAAAQRLLWRRRCGPHVLEAETAPETLARARAAVPLLRARLAGPVTSERTLAPVRALHRALLAEMTALKREADAALSGGSSSGSSSSSSSLLLLLRYEQCLTLAVAGLLLDGVYRVPLPLAPLRALLEALLDLVVRAQRRYAGPAAAAETVAQHVARFRALRRACVHQCLVGAVAAACLDTAARTPARAAPARTDAFPQVLADIDAFFADPHTPAHAEMGTLARTQELLGVLDREAAAPVPGVWRTLHRVAHTDKEPAVARAGAESAAVYALHARRVRQHPAHAKVYDVPLHGRVATDLHRVVRAALAGFDVPVPPDGDAVAALETDGAALLQRVLAAAGSV